MYYSNIKVKQFGRNSNYRFFTSLNNVIKNKIVLSKIICVKIAKRYFPGGGNSVGSSGGKNPNLPGKGGANNADHKSPQITTQTEDLEKNHPYHPNAINSAINNTPSYKPTYTSPSPQSSPEHTLPSFPNLPNSDINHSKQAVKQTIDNALDQKAFPYAVNDVPPIFKTDLETNKPKNQPSKVLTDYLKAPLNSSTSSTPPVHINHVTSITSTTPVPPPLPPMPPKPINYKPDLPQTAFTEDLKDKAQILYNGNNNLKPSQVKELINRSGKNIKTFDFANSKQGDFKKEQLLEEAKTIIFKNHANIEYTTTINNDTTIDDISDSDLRKEMINRLLIKNDQKNDSALSIKTSNDENILIGASKSGYKLSIIGAAYHNKITSPIYYEKPIDNTEHEFELIIALPPEPTQEMFIESAKQKHLLIVYDKDNENYYVLGYLTGKKDAEPLNQQLFKNYQIGKENNNNIKLYAKTQQIVYFKYPEKLEKTDIKRAKWDTEYINSLSPTSLNDLLDNSEEIMKQKFYTIFDKIGITKEEALRICKEHDEIVKKDGKHPLTENQIKQNKQHKEKQNKQNKEKQNENQKNNDINYKD